MSENKNSEEQRKEYAGTSKFSVMSKKKKSEKST